MIKTYIALMGRKHRMTKKFKKCEVSMDTIFVVTLYHVLYYIDVLWLNKKTYKNELCGYSTYQVPTCTSTVKLMYMNVHGILSLCK